MLRDSDIICLAFVNDWKGSLLSFMFGGPWKE